MKKFFAFYFFVVVFLNSSAAKATELGAYISPRGMYVIVKGDCGQKFVSLVENFMSTGYELVGGSMSRHKGVCQQVLAKNKKNKRLKGEQAWSLRSPSFPKP